MATEFPSPEWVKASFLGLEGAELFEGGTHAEGGLVVVGARDDLDAGRDAVVGEVARPWMMPPDSSTRSANGVVASAISSC
jgi:hypothetical protein